MIKYNSFVAGKRNEGIDVSAAAKGVNRAFTQTIGKKTFSGGKPIVGVPGPEPATYVVPPQIDHAYPMAGQQQQLFYNDNNNAAVDEKTLIKVENNIENVWMGLPAINANSSSAAWQELSDLGIVANGLPVYQQPIIDLDTRQQDVFQTLENDLPSGFDLLSYLCEVSIHFWGIDSCWEAIYSARK